MRFLRTRIVASGVICLAMAVVVSVAVRMLNGTDEDVLAGSAGSLLAFGILSFLLGVIWKRKRAVDNAKSK